MHAHVYYKHLRMMATAHKRQNDVRAHHPRRGGYPTGAWEKSPQGDDPCSAGPSPNVTCGRSLCAIQRHSSRHDG